MSEESSTTLTVPFMFGCTMQRTWNVPFFGNVTVNLGALPAGIPELTVFAPVKALLRVGAKAAPLNWMSGVVPPHQ